MQDQSLAKVRDVSNINTLAKKKKTLGGRSRSKEMRRSPSKMFGRKSPSKMLIFRSTSSGISTHSESSSLALKVYENEMKQSYRNLATYEKPQLFEKQLSIRSFRFKSTKKLIIKDDDSPRRAVSVAVTKGEQKRRIRFSEVTVNYHPIIVGDNPGGTQGPPLTIAWEKVSSDCTSLDDYEDLRDGKRRDSKKMQMRASHRREVLKNLGFSQNEMNVGIKSANIARGRRKATLARLDHYSLDYALEKISRSARNIITFGAKKRKEKVYLEKHVPRLSMKDNSTERISVE